MCCDHGLCDILYRFALNALGHLLRHLARTRLAEAGVGLGREPRHRPHLLLSHLGMDSSRGGWSWARSRAEACSSFIKPSGHDSSRGGWSRARREPRRCPHLLSHLGMSSRGGWNQAHLEPRYGPH